MAAYIASTTPAIPEAASTASRLNPQYVGGIKTGAATHKASTRNSLYNQ